MQPSPFLIRLSWTQPILHLIFSTCSAEEGEWETSRAGIWVPKFSFPLSLHWSVQTRKAPPTIPPRDHQTLSHWSFSTCHRDMSHISQLVWFCPLCALDVKCKGWGKGWTATALMPVFVAALVRSCFSKQCWRLIALSSMLHRLRDHSKTWPNFTFISNPF